MKKMFETHGLKVTGTPEQCELYNHDEHAYDYIKGTIEHMVKYAERYAGEDVTVRYARVQGQNRLAIVNQNKEGISTAGKLLTDVGSKTKVFIHDGKNNRFTDEISVDDLEIMKKERYLETAQYMLDAPMTNAINDELKKGLAGMYNQKVKMQMAEESGVKYKPQPLDNSKQELKSERGFYVGDPALVLKDSILNRGVRLGQEMQTGIYTVDGERMVIAPATNGRHGGHDIYSRTIGVVPLELVDTDKIKALPSDMLDIRDAGSMNLILKQNRMFLAQSSIEEINTRDVDAPTMETDDFQYN